MRGEASGDRAVNLTNPTNEELDEMIRLFGGDSMAVRIANALHFHDIRSMGALNGLLMALGESGLRKRLVDVRNLGEKALERIAQGLTEYRAAGPDFQEGMKSLETVLPAGFARRAYCTALHFRDHEGEPFPEVFDFGEPMGLTREDLFALTKMFSFEIVAKSRSEES